MTLISVAAAAQLIQTHWPDWGETTVSLDHPHMAPLRETIVTDRPYPPGDRVMMDGIALNHGVYQAGQRRFPVLGTVAAGDKVQPLGDSKGCVEIMTGALLPPDCDLVIPYEDLEINAGIAQVTATRERLPYEFVHRQGSDLGAGVPVLTVNDSLNGPRWGILASVGKTSVKVRRSPKIQIISTGDELVAVTDQPQPHQLRRSNSYALQASLLKAGYRDIALTHLPDDPIAITDHYRQAVTQFDLLIYSGGVSKGKFDYLPNLWQQEGATQYFHGVAQRPGKPLWFGGDHRHNTIIFGLPGNPISSLVCLHRYVLDQPAVYVQLTADVHFEPPLTYFLPVKVTHNPNAALTADPLPVKNSGEFLGLAQSSGFVELPADQSTFKTGDCFRFFAW